MKLAGINVLDMSMTTAGARLTGALADQGADILIVEPNDDVGHPLRVEGEKMFDRHFTRFRKLARGKRSVRLNLHEKKDQTWLMSLAKSTDIIVSTAEPCHEKPDYVLDYAVIKAVNPGLIYCTLTAFGREGFGAAPEDETLRGANHGRAYHDLDIQALTGVLGLNRDFEGRPVMPGLPYAEMAGVMSALAAISMALYRREKTGFGDMLDIALYDSLLSWTEPVTDPIFTGLAPIDQSKVKPMNRNAFCRVYEVRGGDFIVLTETRLEGCQRLLTMVGREDLIAFVKGSSQEQAELIIFLRDIFSRKTLQDWEEILDVLALSWSPVRDLSDAFDDPHTRHREMTLKDKDGYQHVGTALKFLDEPAVLNFDVPENRQEETD